MSYGAELREILQEYDQAVQKLQQNRKMFDGVFGLGVRPGDAACHEVMDRKVEELCRRAAEEPQHGETAELTGRILRAEASWEGPEYARLALTAIQRHTIPLIPRLNGEEREELRAWYEKRYPRRLRLPVQIRILKLLKTPAGEAVR